MRSLNISKTETSKGVQATKINIRSILKYANDTAYLTFIRQLWNRCQADNYNIKRFSRNFSEITDRKQEKGNLFTKGYCLDVTLNSLNQHYKQCVKISWENLRFEMIN